MIPIYKPYLPTHILKHAHDALDSGWVSSVGKYKDLATTKLQEVVGINNILLVNNGTSAMHLVAKALKYKYPNIRSIIVPNNVYVAAWNAFLFDRDYSLKPIDADLNTWNFNLKNLHPQTEEAILFVHNLGNIINVPNLRSVFPDTIFVEDNCEGFLGKYNGRHSGTESFCSAVSFFGNKNITSGEGGAVYVRDDDVFEYLCRCHGQGQSDKRYVHNFLGYNYRMTNIQASILYGQLEYLHEIIERKELVFERYREAFKNTEGILMQDVEDGAKHSNWMMGIRVINNSCYEKAEIFFGENQIEIRPMFYPMSAHNHLLNYTHIDNELNARQLAKECFILPSYPELKSGEIDLIIKNVKKYLLELK